MLHRLLLSRTHTFTMALTAEEKNMVCPRLINFDRFAYTRKNINISNVSYECKHKRRDGGMCNAKLQFNRCTFSGKIDFDNKIAVGQHLQRCYSLNGMKPPLIVHDDMETARKRMFIPIDCRWSQAVEVPTIE